MTKPTPNPPFKKGDILKGAVRDRDKANHYIVFLKPAPAGDFEAIMLTSSDRYKDNLAMKAEHFSVLDRDGLTSFSFNKTHFVRQSFVKFHELGPYSKVGSLTNAGLKYIKKNKYDTAPMEFGTYKKLAC